MYVEESFLETLNLRLRSVTILLFKSISECGKIEEKLKEKGMSSAGGWSRRAWYIEFDS